MRAEYFNNFIQVPVPAGRAIGITEGPAFTHIFLALIGAIKIFQRQVSKRGRILRKTVRRCEFFQIQKTKFRYTNNLIRSVISCNPSGIGAFLWNFFIHNLTSFVFAAFKKQL